MTKPTDTDTIALHIDMQNGKHVVAVKSLKVLLSQDDGSWFAQGLEIDYAAAGTSLGEAKQNFASGLEKTIAEHLKMHGTIEKFLVVAPQSAWEEYFGADDSNLQHTVTTVQLHKIGIGEQKEQKQNYFPFKQIEFLEPLAA